MNSIEKLDNARQLLAEARTLEDVQQIRDVATLAGQYARAVNLGLEASNHAAEIRLLAERKAGELLAQLERGRGNRFTVEDSRLESSTSEYRVVLEENEVSPVTAHRWQKVAAIPEETFVEFIETTKAEKKELTQAGALRVAQRIAREERHSKPDPDPVSGMFRVWYADPPWSYGNSGVITGNDAYGRAARHYPTMTIDELCAMGDDIRGSCEKDAVLFMWVTSPLLEECFPVINAWGFKYKTSFVWDKVRHNFGHYNSVRHELLLVCTRGSCTPDTSKLYNSVVREERTNKHSEKPESFRAIIDDLYPHGQRIELFSRTEAEGWNAWGNE